MPRIFDRLDGRKSKDIRVLSNFISVFCQENHRDQAKDTFDSRDARLDECLGKKDLILCQDCQKLLHHGIAKLLQCPYDPKPTCKKCQTHCYAPGYRESIRQVMRFSGPYLLKRGRLDLLVHYFL